MDEIALWCFFAYALINFFTCMALNSMGGAGVQNGKYVLESHGRVLKELTKAEYEKAEAVTTRAFSGHWMLFYSASMMLLSGVYELRRRKISGEPLIYINGDKEDEKPETARNGKSIVARSMRGELDLDAETRRCNATQENQVLDANVEVTPKRKIALICLFAYIISILIILSTNLVLNLLLTPFLCYVGVISIKRVKFRNKRGNGEFKSLLGCFSIIPNFFIAFKISSLIMQFLCVIIYVGFIPAITGDVTFIETAAGPSALSDGTLINVTLLGILTMFTFPFTILFMAGLTGLMEYFGRGFKM